MRLPCHAERCRSCFKMYASRRSGSRALWEAITCPKTSWRWQRRMVVCIEYDHFFTDVSPSALLHSYKLFFLGSPVLCLVAD